MTKGNILIIDDEIDILQTLKELLHDHAKDIFLASGGKEALRILKEKSVQCVICDVKMPGMTGVEVIKEVRASVNEVPFIFFTGHGSQDLMMEVVKYGVFDFLNKPEFDGLEEVVARGLKEGFKPPEAPLDASIYVSEYRKMLDIIDKKGKTGP